MAEIIEGCCVTWREGGSAANPDIPGGGQLGSVRRLASVQVRRTAGQTVEFTRPRSGVIVVKRIFGKHLTITDADGADVIKRWLTVQ